MVKHVFCVKDELVGFLPPILEENVDVAIRNFKRSLLEMSKGDFNAPLCDFNLYEMGIFNRKSGIFETHEPKIVYLGVKVEKEMKEAKDESISNDLQ